MNSIFATYEYDIFISYRHNDNQFDGWVTEFVEKLKMELHATLKDKLHIYFDQSKNEGLHENHLVGESLGPKLNAAFFIPIVSKTYCDLESFAWSKEFCAFIENNKATGNPLEITLPNGNVASRILPIRIHNLDMEDSILIEQNLNGRLRSIDFVYEQAGTDRPLRLRDDDHYLPGNLVYRNQINKVALAIKELVAGMKQGSSRPLATNFTASIPELAYTRQIVANRYQTERIESQTVSETSTAKKVFLAWTSADLKTKREELLITLQKAGFDVFPAMDCPSEESDFERIVSESLENSDFSIHLMSTEYGRRFEENDQSFPGFQYEKAKEFSDQKKLQQVVWQLVESGKEFKSQQSELIRQIRNQLNANCIFSNASNPMQLVDELRNQAKAEEKEVLMPADSTEIFFIYNQQDNREAEVITDFLSSEYPLEVLMIEPNTEDEYRKRTVRQLPETRLAVIYFKHSGDWAIPFIKQVWKEVGGAKARNQFVLLGEDDPKTNLLRSFKAPKVISRIVGKTQITHEIKNIYENLSPAL
jgi:hypothetical protein